MFKWRSAIEWQIESTLQSVSSGAMKERVSIPLFFMSPSLFVIFIRLKGCDWICKASRSELSFIIMLTTISFILVSFVISRLKNLTNSLNNALENRK